MKNIILYLGLVLLTVVLSSSTPSVQTKNISQWTKLGSKKVNYRLDKDVLHIGPKYGVFSKLKLVVSDGNLQVNKMQVEYQNGQTEAIQLKHKFEKKSSTRIIDLNGKRRIIKSVAFSYKTDNRSRKKAKVTVFGK